MTNKKFKLAAMSLALTACVAASPLAANAEAGPETEPPVTTVSGENTPTTNEPKQDNVDESNQDNHDESNQDNRDESNQDNHDESNQDNHDESNQDNRDESNQDNRDESNQDNHDESNQDNHDESNQDNHDESNQDNHDESNQDNRDESNQDNHDESNQDNHDESNQDNEESKQDNEESKQDNEESKQNPADEAKQNPADVNDPNAAVENNDLAAPAQLMTTSLAKAPAEAKTVATITKNGTTTNYTSFDDAVNAAEKGDTIEVVEDADTYGMMLKDKKLTIQGAKKATQKNEDGTEEETTVKPKLTFKKQGIALLGTELTFKDMQVDMIGIGSTPYEWKWVTICAQNKSVLELDNTNMTLDGSNTGDKHAIFFDGPNQYLNVKNGSNLTIQNYQEDALEWNDGRGGYNCNITGGSTYTSDNNRSGFTGTFYVTVDDSDVKVIKSRSNGSNGSYFTIKNGSDVLFDNNSYWGISAWRIDMNGDSTLTATNNGYSGVWTRVLNVDKTCTLDVESNGQKAGTAATNPGILFNGYPTIKSTIEEGADVTIKNNAGSGIYTKNSFCDLTIGSATITNNGSGTVNKSGKGAENGGGIYNIGTIKLGKGVTINNNAASEAGADLYVGPGGKLTFSVGNAGIGDILDKGPDGTDCGHKIDGWYIDANGARWDFDTDADSAQAFLGSLDELPDGVTASYDQATGLYTIAVDKTAGNGFALKAAHAELPAPTPDPDPNPNPDPDPNPEPKPGPDTPVTPEDPQLPPVQDARADTPDSPVLPANPTNPAVQDAHALPQTGTSLFAALAMALSGVALTLAGAWASLLGKNSRH